MFYGINMKFNKNGSLFIISLLLILFLSISMVAASEISADDASYGDISADSAVSDINSQAVSIQSEDSLDYSIQSGDSIADSQYADYNSPNDSIQAARIDSDISGEKNITVGSDATDDKKSYRGPSLADGDGELHGGIGESYYSKGTEGLSIRFYDELEEFVALDLSVYFNDEFFGNISTEDYYIPVDDLDLGLNNITMVFDGDEDYHSFSLTQNFTVYEERTYIDLDVPSQILVDGDNIYDISLLDNSGNLLNYDFYLELYFSDDMGACISNVSFTKNGTANLTDMMDGVGEYSYFAIFDGSEDYKYSPCSLFNTFEAYNYLTSLRVKDIVYIPEERLEFTVKMIDEITEEILNREFTLNLYYVIWEDDENYEIHYILENVTVNGNETFLLSDELAGITSECLYLELNFEGDENYSSASCNELIVNSNDGLESYIEINMDSYIFASSLDTIVVLREYDSWDIINGSLDIYLNDEYVDTIEVSSDNTHLQLNDLSKGNHTLILSYNGTETYQGNSRLIEFTVCDVESDLNIIADDLLVGDDFVLEINLTEAESGKSINMTFYADLYKNDGEFSELVDSYKFNSSGKITIPGLPVGTYYVEAYFEDEDYVYSPSKESIYFNVYNKSTSIIHDTFEYPDNDDVILNLRLFNMLDQCINGTINIEFENNSYSVNVTDEGGSLNLGKLPLGNYSLLASFDGDDDYIADNETLYFRVSKATILKIETQDVPEGETATVNVIFTDGDNNPLNISWVYLNIFDTDRKYFDYGNMSNFIEIPNVTKDYIIFADFDNYVEYGADKYCSSYAYGFVRVLNETGPQVLPVAANASIDLSVVGDEVVVVLKDLDGNVISNGTLSVVVGSVSSNLTTDGAGRAVLPIGVNETAEFTYTDANGASVSSSIVNNLINITVEKEVPSPVASNRTSTRIIYENMKTTAVAKVDGKVGKYFEVVLVDEKGNPIADKLVQIGFNGAVYNRTTNETGGVKLQINLGYEGKYTFAIAFLGDDNYTGDFQVALIEVTPHIPKLTAPAKTYKASAKTKALTATFKSANGNAISGKKISFTINGKTYTGTTNSKGVATVKISLNKRGTYQATAKYAGDGMYKETSTKFKVKIS